ncbi:MAG TPA: phenylalanine--tRNA ligase subunit beta [bacterium]|nr:phenylalanine--tRNA ligase subunit beta [bacterium]
MRVPLDWLRELVAIEVPPEALVQRLPMLGLGSEGIDRVGDEPVLDLETAANRPDLLSILGVAREIAAAWRLEVRPPAISLSEGPTPASDAADVTIEDPIWCPRYTAHVITGVRVGPSPAWMVRRLEAAGIRSVSNIVDVTNYVMLEQGEPLHAFDLDGLRGRRIEVRRARAGEPLVTLDGVARTLDPEMLVIADAARAVALAGVMGGGDSEISAGTTRVLLEAAAFDGAQVRRTSRRLGLRTESSVRFERGVDPRIVLDAARRAAALIVEVGGGEVLAGVIDRYPAPARAPQIALRLARIPRLLGVEVPADEVEAILRRLGCALEPASDGFTVTAPPGRLDLQREEDLIEEVARHYGYDRLPETTPVAATQAGSRAESLESQDAARDVLIRAGLSEAVTLSLISPGVFDRLGLPPEDGRRRAVTLLNPLLSDHTHLRTMILPGLLEATRVNLSRRIEDVHLFEIGRTFHLSVSAASSRRSAGTPSPPPEGPAGAAGIAERRTLGVAMRGRLRHGWNVGAEAAEITFFDLKGVLEALWSELRVAPETIAAEPAAHPWLHPGRSARLLLGGQEIGVLGELHPGAAQRFDLTGRVYAAEIDLDAILPHATLRRRFVPLPRHPAVERDLALFVPTAVPQSQVLHVIAEAGGTLLEAAELFDVYEGAQAPAGRRSLAYALRFRAADRTLTGDEVDGVMAAIHRALETELDARPRT